MEEIKNLSVLYHDEERGELAGVLYDISEKVLVEGSGDRANAEDVVVIITDGLTPSINTGLVTTNQHQVSNNQSTPG